MTDSSRGVTSLKCKKTKNMSLFFWEEVLTVQLEILD